METELTMNKEKKNFAPYLLWLILGAGILTVFDQWTKYLAVTHLKGQKSIVLIPGVLELEYLENRGAAFGILTNQQWFFYIITVVMAAVIIWIYFKMPRTKRFLPAHIVAVVILSGALGNFIDRVRLKYVVDFIYFSLIDFPIFNVADIYVTVSAVMVFLLVLFVYKEEDYEFLKRKEK